MSATRSGPATAIRLGRMRVAKAAVLVAASTIVAGLVFPVTAHADAVRDGQWYFDALGITRAHTISQGQGVKVAVIDSGVDGSVPDLQGAVTAGKDFSGQGSPDGQDPVDGDAHGTNVASVLAGRGHGSGNDSGVLGTAPGSMVLSASTASLSDNSGTQVAQAVRWAVDQGASVINMSFGGASSPQEQSAFAYAQSHDVVLVTASGNDGAQSGGPPCNLDGIVCVAGVDKNLKRDPDSNADEHVAVAAPYATKAGAAKTPTPRDGLPVAEPASGANQYAGEVGTSLSAPIVAGVVAMIRQHFRNLDAANVINRLIRTATPAGSGRPNSEYGYGVVDAYRALTADVPSVTRNPMGSLAKSSATPVRSQPATSPESQEDGTSPGTGNTPQPEAFPDSGSDTGLIVGVIAATVVVVGVAATLLVARSRRRRY